MPTRRWFPAQSGTVVNGLWARFDTETMLRTCNHCGFQWTETPLDHSGTPNLTLNLKEAARKARARQSYYIAARIRKVVPGASGETLAKFVEGLAESG